MSGHSGVQGDLLSNSGTANGLQQLYGANAAGVNNTLTPALTSEVANPQGYTPQQMAAQTTAAEQTAGGSNAGATGGALLRAVRTRNAGAAPAAIDQANRSAGQNLSQINAGIQTKNADLQQRQRQQGISGLEGLYGENVGAQENALGASNSALNDAGHLNNFWQQLLTQGIQTGGQVASAALMG
jgi:hypothetical protein